MKYGGLTWGSTRLESAKIPHYNQWKTKRNQTAQERKSLLYFFFFGIVFPLFGILQIMGVKQKPGKWIMSLTFTLIQWMEIFRVLLLNGTYTHSIWLESRLQERKIWEDIAEQIVWVTSCLISPVLCVPSVRSPVLSSYLLARQVQIGVSFISLSLKSRYLLVF